MCVQTQGVFHLVMDACVKSQDWQAAWTHFHEAVRHRGLHPFPGDCISLLTLLQDESNLTKVWCNSPMVCMCVYV